MRIYTSTIVKKLVVNTDKEEEVWPMKDRALSTDQSNEAWFLPQYVLPVPFFPQQSWQEANHLHIYQGITWKYLKDLDLWHLNQK